MDPHFVYVRVWHIYKHSNEIIFSIFDVRILNNK